MTSDQRGSRSRGEKALDPAARTGIILGSGLGRLTEAMTDCREIPFDAIPIFPSPPSKGHSGRLISGRLVGATCWPCRGAFTTTRVIPCQR
jgi:purine-nucleoside phosphorylase